MCAQDKVKREDFLLTCHELDQGCLGSSSGGVRERGNMPSFCARQASISGGLMAIC